MATGYRYQFVTQRSTLISKFYKVSSDTGTGWLLGNGAFGTINSTCPISNPANVKTIWPSNRDVLVRKHFYLPPGASNVKVNLALDNDAQVWMNGVDISAGMKHHYDCASPNDYVFSVPASVLKVGDNLIAFRGKWHNSLSYVDIQVTGLVSKTITASAGPHGSITPSGAVSVSPGANQTFRVKPDTGYYIATLTIDGNPVPVSGKDTSITFTT